MPSLRQRSRPATTARTIKVATDRLAEPVDTEAQPRLPFPVVGIGGSAGGLEAFIEFFKAMPTDSGVAFVLVQHLSPDRESMVTEILSRHTAMPVAEVTDGLRIEPNHVYMIRPGRTLTIRDGRLHLGEAVEKPGHRRPVDDFFRSLAEEQRERALCVIMSGMGSNGTAGAQAIKAVGGMCIAQDPETAKFPDMPRSLIDTGLADFILRPTEIPPVIIRYITHPYASGARNQSAAEQATRADQHALNEILTAIRSRVRHDFSGYKKPTLLRRVQRRMGLNQITAMSDYARTLRQNPTEIAALSDDLLIHVTGFFRDREAWDALREKVITPLITERTERREVRAWVTACSTGEEAYSLAMLLVEAAEAAKKRVEIKIFATDMADRSLGHARAGLFPGGIESDISPERLERFFDKEDSSYRVKKELRERVVFAPQNVLEDPPFSHLDICTCRNLLIYLEPEVQRRVLSLLHFGLREGGGLFLGTSETVPAGDDMFEVLDKKHRIFRRIGPTRHDSVEFPIGQSRTSSGENDALNKRAVTRGSIAQITSRTLLERFGPPAVVVDRQLHIVYFHGNTERYLDQPRGEPTRELMSLVREPVRGAVRTALHQAMTHNEAVTARDGSVGKGDDRKRIEICVMPLEAVGSPSHYLVAFHEFSEPETLPLSVTENRDLENRQLMGELRRARDELQSTIEELQTSNEELKAANEESTSINEELQSTNEEIETSKEELQSLNEELTTANAQLQTKMEELEAATNDLSSLLSSTDIAVVFLDTNFRIRRFTPAVKDLFELIPGDAGRPLSDLARKFDDPELLRDAQAVLKNFVPIEKEIRSESGRVYVRRALPYRTADNRIGGVVITFVDISGRRNAEAALGASEERYRLILEGVQEYAIFMLDPEGMITTWTPAAERIVGFSEEEAIGETLSLFCTRDDVESGLPEKLVEQARKTGAARAEHWHVRKDGSTFWGSGVLSALWDRNRRLQGYVKVLRDNTDRKLAEESLRESKREAEAANEAKDQFLANVSHELRTPLSCMLLWAMLLDEQKNPSPDMLREGLDMIKKSAEEQRELIEDLVDTARIATGKFTLEPTEVELVQVVRAALDLVVGMAREKDLSIAEVLDPSVGVVFADPHRLQQVVWNLLSNAVKFTPGGGRVDVVLHRRGEEVELRVSDTGVGISKDFLPHVFDRFGQQDGSTSRSNGGGLGLGLAIAKHIVELHAGTIVAESAGLDRGAVFTVRLPLPSLSLSLVPNIAVPVPLADALTGVSILLVEDTADTQRAMVAVLEETGAHITAVTTMAAAFEEYRARTPDLIVSDIGLPDGDGCDLIAQIRAFEKGRNSKMVPALAFTAYAGEKSLRKVHDSGFQDCLTKPVAPARLVASLRALHLSS